MLERRTINLLLVNVVQKTHSKCCVFFVCSLLRAISLSSLKQLVPCMYFEYSIVSAIFITCITTKYLARSTLRIRTHTLIRLAAFSLELGMSQIQKRLQTHYCGSDCGFRTRRLLIFVILCKPLCETHL